MMANKPLPMQKNISSAFSRNSKSNVLEFPENLEEIFPRYYMHSDVYVTY